MHELFIEIFGNLADHSNRQGDDVSGIQRRKGPQQPSGTRNGLANSLMMTSLGLHMPCACQEILPHGHELRANAEDVQMSSIGQQKVPQLQDLR